MFKADRHLEALELNKILVRLADFTACEDAKNMALELKPESNLNLARALLAQTNDAHILLARFGGP
ncbi:MAG TPA: hypothetical protein P5127_01365, partial [Oscillospiraceae bacterium]|nr:hypothetical protein [Oscillospiraceae bacterium]